MPARPDQPRGSLSEIGQAVQDACRAAVRETLIEHKLRGWPVASAENGKVKWIPANEIVIPPEEPK